jgi:hypothetical protein
MLRKRMKSMVHLTLQGLALGIKRKRYMTVAAVSVFLLGTRGMMVSGDDGNDFGLIMERLLRVDSI